MARIFSAARLAVLPFVRPNSRAMSFSPPYKWISADELAKILKDPAEKQATAIIDVRGTYFIF